MFGDPQAGCAHYYWCSGPVQVVMPCARGTAFDDATQVCTWPSLARCGASPEPTPRTSPKLSPEPKPKPKPSSPSPKPKTSPKPKPKPKTSPKPKTRRSPSPSPSPSLIPGLRSFCGAYYESWADPWVSSAATSSLLGVQGQVVYLSFVQPDASFSGTFAGTGLQFSSDIAVVRDAIARLRQRGVKVLLAVGGASYGNWAALNPAGIAGLVRSLGAHGVDIDYEPSSPGCTGGGGPCASDAEYVAIVQRLRAALPRPYALSAAVWSTGAFTTQPPLGPYTGMARVMLQRAGPLLDWINVMAYDAGTEYSPTQALAEYKKLFQGPVALGVEVPPEAWGGHVLSLTEAQALAKAAGGNVFVWAWHKAGSPSARQILSATKCA